MQTSAPDAPGADAGFSLIEALLVIMILGLTAGAVMLAAPGPDRAARDAATSFAARTLAASDESVLRNRTVALVLTSEGYGFAQQEASGWLRIADTPALAFRRWPEGVDVRLERGEALGQEVLGQSPYAVQFDAMGSATPAAFVFSAAGANWEVEIDGEGRARVAPLR